MSAYNELMAKINASSQATEQQVDERSLITKTLEVLDQATSEAYGRTVDAIAAQYGAAKVNVRATPALFNKGVKRGEERAAAVLLKLLAK